MEITVIDALVLTGVQALLMVNYAARRIAAAQATRGLIKDHIKDTRHHNHGKTLLVLRSRMSALTATLAFTALATISSFFAAVFIVFGWTVIAKIVFVISIALGVIGLFQSLRDSYLSNQSHFSELDNTISKDDPYYGAGAP